MSFKKSAVIISIILLILSLVGIGFALSKASQNKEWPPQMSKCPDYWDYDDIKQKCMNTLNIGSGDEDTDCAPEGMDPLEDNSKTSRCAKYDQINNLNATTVCANKITWDGITNSTEC